MSLDIVIIGAGANALVAATLLARAGLNVVVLERRDRVGGCAATAEVAPGFHCPALAHAVAIDARLVKALDLARHGLEIIRSAALACAPANDGAALVLWRDQARAVDEIRRFSPADADRYPRFLESFARISGVLRAVADASPPDIDDPGAADLLRLLTTGRRFRALGK